MVVNKVLVLLTGQINELLWFFVLGWGDNVVVELTMVEGGVLRQDQPACNADVRLSGAARTHPSQVVGQVRAVSTDVV